MIQRSTPLPSTAGRRRGRWRALVVALVTSGFLGLVPTTPAPPAEAADLSTWQAGSIISDAMFFDGRAMTRTEIATFLQVKGAKCSPRMAYDYRSGGVVQFSCLKDYRQDTESRAADAFCDAYVGRPDQPIADIIADVAVACGVSPKALLVTLQKEQSLVTSARPEWSFREAMGFGCPDFSTCNPAYRGTFAQIYSGARQFQRYVAPGSTFRYQAGRVNQIQYHPKLECGSTPVFIENRATAALYNYTPYQPNAAALAAGYGTGDGCSAYGNRNFYQYFWDWFGNPRTQTAPVGALDTVSAAIGQIRLNGWTFDRDIATPLTVHVYVDGKATATALADQARPDVSAFYGVPYGTGYRATVPATTGSHEVCVFAIDGNGGPLNPRLGCRTVDVPANSTPKGNLDLAATGDGTITVHGWAFDVDTPDPVQVHVYLDGKAVRSVRTDQARPDVAQVYGVGTTVGYRATFAATAGDHEVCVYAINVPTGPNPRIGCRTVFVDLAARGALDHASGSHGTLTVSGWAFDRNNDPDPVTVEIDVDGVLAGSVVAADPRPDVAQGFQVGPNHGFRTTVPFVPGTREVCVFAIDQPSGARTPITCRSVAMDNAAPLSHLDDVTGGAGELTVLGWAFDPDTPDPISVHVYVDGVAVRNLRADQARPDVGAVHPGGGTSGFQARIKAAQGVHEVCTFAINWPEGVNPRIGCRTVEVAAGLVGPTSSDGLAETTAPPSDAPTQG